MFQRRSIRAASTPVSNAKLPVGDRKPSGRHSTFAAFAALEEEEVVPFTSNSSCSSSYDPPRVVASPSPWSLPMDPTILWTDILNIEEGGTAYEPPATDRLPKGYHLRGTFEQLLALRCCINVEYDPDRPGVLYTENLFHGEFCELMTWLYAMGWVVHENCSSHRVIYSSPAALPPRVWVPADSPWWAPFWDPESCPPPPPAVCPVAPRKKTATIPRFCRSAACADAGCRYIHENTIPRLNEACAFGAGCGASDPTGVKRSQCLRMHPGETWTTELVITRPSA